VTKGIYNEKFKSLLELKEIIGNYEAPYFQYWALIIIGNQAKNH